LKRLPRFKQTIKMGRLESNFISQIVKDMSYLQPLAMNCTQVLVWHTKTDTRIPMDVIEPNPGDPKGIYNKIKMEV
jgi:hypothetical protein